jgi:dUTPase
MVRRCQLEGRLIETDLQIKLSANCYGRNSSRSGLAQQHHFDIGAGVVDEDDRGVLCVVLFNHSDNPFKVSRGDRIAQFICKHIYYPELEEVKELLTVNVVKMDLVHQDMYMHGLAY